MSGILSFLRDAIAPAAVARATYLHGQEAEKDKQRAQAIQDSELRRQSILDQIRASVDKSTIERNTAQADRYGALAVQQPRDSYEIVKDEDGTQYLQNKNNPKDIQPITVNGRALKAPSSATAQSTPHTIRTSKGILMWDPVSRTFKPTGYDAPARPTNNAQDRLDVKTALDEATKNLPRPSKTPAEITNPDILNAKPGQDIKKMPIRVANPARAKVEADSVAYDNDVVKPLRQHLIDVTVGDKVKTGSGSRAPSLAPTPTPKPAKPTLDKNQNAAMQREFDQASADLNTVLNSNAPKAVRDQARALYDQHQAAIAKKYGVTSSTP